LSLSELITGFLIIFLCISGVKMTSGGGGNSSLVVPMVMWGPQAPTHCISAIYLMRDQKTLLTGASDGQVILWEVDITTQKSSGNFYLNYLLIIYNRLWNHLKQKNQFLWEYNQLMRYLGKKRVY
jgi:hypothetical protein